MLQSNTYYRLVIGMHCFKLRISLKSLIVGERVVGGGGKEWVVLVIWTHFSSLDFF